MRPIPLNIMTLYADLMQSVGQLSAMPGSLAAKTVKKRKYLYVTSKDGSARIERYLGPADDPHVVEQANEIRHASEQAKALRNTVALLKRARVPAPTLVQGRILEVLANAGLFKRGLTLVGTVAYQAYACIVGSYLAASAYATRDMDLSVAEFVAGEDEEDIGSTLKRADASFKPLWHATDTRLPRVFQSASFRVEILTRYGRGRQTPVPIESLGCAAEALSFQEYPVEETMEVVALYGSGVLIRVPTPLRYAVHKLIVAQQRKRTELAKKQKDLRQAEELIDIFLETDDVALQDALDEARSRGKSWRSAINASLGELGREARQGMLPVAAKPRRTLARAT
jgi:hypothetical protein